MAYSYEHDLANKIDRGFCETAVLRAPDGTAIAGAPRVIEMPTNWSEVRTLLEAAVEAALYGLPQPETVLVRTAAMAYDADHDRRILSVVRDAKQALSEADDAVQRLTEYALSRELMSDHAERSRGEHERLLRQ